MHHNLDELSANQRSLLQTLFCHWLKALKVRLNKVSGRPGGEGEGRAVS